MVKQFTCRAWGPVRSRKWPLYRYLDRGTPGLLWRSYGSGPV